MLAVNSLVDLRIQQQIAHEIYRQQIIQRLPDPYPTMLPMHLAPHHIILPPCLTLNGIEAKLENNDLWQQFHRIGTEMIITKSGRRMFPSMRVSLAGLEEESNYCVLLEMIPIGDCRYKFSGSQWVPAGGAEPQSPQRIFLHPDSPATGAHWQAHPILFNKVKLTNNTLDNNGHVVLASMHKYQPRFHIIRTANLAELPWVPQQTYVFPETEFVAVTAYQNDRITKLKIDNNPFAKGFRETGQSRCKRKLQSQLDADANGESQIDAAVAVGYSQALSSPEKGSSNAIDDDHSSISSYEAPPQSKRLRFTESIEDDGFVSSGSVTPPRFEKANVNRANNIYNIHPHHAPAAVAIPRFYPHLHTHHNHAYYQRSLLPLELSTVAAGYYDTPPFAATAVTFWERTQAEHFLQHPQHEQQWLQRAGLVSLCSVGHSSMQSDANANITEEDNATSNNTNTSSALNSTEATQPMQPQQKRRRNNFSISAILTY